MSIKLLFITVFQSLLLPICIHAQNPGRFSREFIPFGDFESTSWPFTSSYRYTDTIIEAGTYYIGGNANDYFPGFWGKATGDTGQFYIGNGSSELIQKVFAYTVPDIIPEAVYNFSIDLSNVSGGPPSRFAILINGDTVGSPVTAPSVTNQWSHFDLTWRPAGSTIADIVILHLNLEPFGNDFGIDNISLKANCNSIDHLIPQPELGEDTILCGSTLQLNLSPGNNISASIQKKWSTGSSEAVLQVIQPGTYALALDSANLGCPKYDSVTVSLFQPSSPLVTDVSICQGAPLPAIPVGFKDNNTLVWYHDTVTGLPFDAQPFISTDNADTLTLYVSQREKTGNQTCESERSALKIYILPLPSLDYQKEIKACPGSELTLGPLNYSGKYSFRWGFPNESNADTLSTKIVKVNHRNFIPVDTSFVINIKDQSTNCSVQDSIRILMYPHTHLTLDIPDSVCIGQDDILLQGNPSGGFFKGRLVSRQFFKPIKTGPQNIVYYLTDEQNCTDSLSGTIFVKNLQPARLDVGKDTNLCLGQTLVLHGSVNRELKWSPGGEAGNSIMVTPQKSTLYTAMDIDRIACTIMEDSILVTVDLPVGRIFDSVSMQHCFDDGPLNISAGGGSEYLWKKNGETSQQISVTSEGYYHVTVKNGACVESDSMMVTENCPSSVFVPNAFSPNGDGNNDSLEVFGNHLYQFKLKIFNRWGEEIFYSDDFHSYWDGNWNGESQPAGIYPWVLFYNTKLAPGKFSSEPVILKGKVTLVR